MSEETKPTGSTREGIHWTRLGLMLHREDLLESERKAIEWVRERVVRLLVDRMILAAVAREAFYSPSAVAVDCAVKGDEEAAERARELLRVVVGFERTRFSYRKACESLDVEVPPEEVVVDAADVVGHPPDDRDTFHATGPHYVEEVEVPAELVEPRPCELWIPCFPSLISEATVEVLDFSEDPQVADLLKFTCPRCGGTHESRRYG